MASQPISLRLSDYNDRELLRIVHDLSDQNGWVESVHLAEHLFPAQIRAGREDRDQALRCVGQRLSWMRRFGVIQKNESNGKKGSWGLTAAGKTLLLGSIPEKERKVIENLKENQLLDLTETLSMRYFYAGDVAATMMRRQWQFGSIRRKAGQ